MNFETFTRMREASPITPPKPVTIEEAFEAIHERNQAISELRNLRQQLDFEERKLFATRRLLEEDTFELAAANPTFENCVKALTLPPIYHNENFQTCVDAAARRIVGSFPAPGFFPPSDPHPILYASDENETRTNIPIPNFYLPNDFAILAAGALTRWVDVWVETARKFQTVTQTPDMLTFEDPTGGGFSRDLVTVDLSDATVCVYNWNSYREEPQYIIAENSPLKVYFKYLMETASR